MALRSGRRAASIGVGTVTMKKSASRLGRGSLVKLNPGPLEVLCVDLAGPVLPASSSATRAGVDVKADDRTAGARERRSDRQSDITQTNNRDLPAVRHKMIFRSFRDAIDATSADCLATVAWNRKGWRPPNG